MEKIYTNINLNMNDVFCDMTIIMKIATIGYNLYCWPFHKGKINQILRAKIKFIQPTISEYDLNLLIKGIKEKLAIGILHDLIVTLFSETRIFKHTFLPNLAHLEKIFARGKSIIIVMPHCSFYGVIAAKIASEIRHRVTRAIIYGSVSRVFYSRLSLLRRKFGIEFISVRKGAFKELENYLNECTIVSFTPDIYKDSGMEIEFLGKRSKWPTGAATLSIATGTPIVPITAYRKGHNYYIESERLLYPEDFPTKESLMKEVIKIFEQFIIKHPTDWMWTHYRWSDEPKY